MLKMTKISVIAATIALTMTGCATKAELKAISETEFFYTVHHCPVYTEVGTQCKKPESASIIDGDDDNDGVLNSVDQCPRTAPYTKVDAKGCMVVAEVDGDDDKDGVLNSADKCPTTHKNVTKVDTDGCAVAVNLHINFKFDSYEVTNSSINNIKDFAAFMNEHQDYKANIEGHTDASGPAEYNQMLSQKRAQVVADLIATEGNVDAKRLTAVGKGESTPVASNDTKAGRSENRRTEAHIIK